jgi:hypothetical protein
VTDRTDVGPSSAGADRPLGRNKRITNEEEDSYKHFRRLRARAEDSDAYGADLSSRREGYWTGPPTDGVQYNGVDQGAAQVARPAPAASPYNSTVSDQQRPQPAPYQYTGPVQVSAGSTQQVGTVTVAPAGTMVTSWGGLVEPATPSAKLAI